jgi:hypothetical protein
MTDNPPGSQDLTPTGKRKHRFRRCIGKFLPVSLYLVVYGEGSSLLEMMRKKWRETYKFGFFVVVGQLYNSYVVILVWRVDNAWVDKYDNEVRWLVIEKKTWVVWRGGETFIHQN